MGVFRSNLKAALHLGAVDISKAFKGREKIYPSSAVVTYRVDSSLIYYEEIESDESILSPKTFTPQKSGWTFAGWRKDSAADGTVLSNEVMEGEEVTLYAVFKRTITLSYNGNGASGGSVSAQTETQYYNNGNQTIHTFALKSNGFSKTNCTFRNLWAMGGTGGTQYAPGASVTLTESMVFYALWTVNPFSYTSDKSEEGSYTFNTDNYSSFTITLYLESDWGYGYINCDTVSSGYSLSCSGGTESRTYTMAGNKGSYTLTWWTRVNGSYGGTFARAWVTIVGNP